MKRLKNRRGAILVMTGILLLVLIGMAAVAMDAGRLHAAHNELRTSADAAALAGARQLLHGGAGAEADARAFALRNRALGEDVVVEQVRFGVWNSLTRTFVATAPGAADAVEVTVRKETKSILPQLFGDDAFDLRAKAIAWSGAPVEGARCVKPFAMIHEDFMTALGKPHWAELTYEDIQQLRDTTGGNKRWMTLNMGNSNNSPDRGNWYAVQLPPAKVDGKVVLSSGGGKPLVDNIAGCTWVKQGDMVITEPGKKVGLVEQGLELMCAQLTEAGKCMNANGTVGVPVAVAIFCTGPELTGGGHMWLEVHYVAAFMLTEFVRGGSDAGKVKGYLINMPGSGQILDAPSPVTKTILVG